MRELTRRAISVVATLGLALPAPAAFGKCTIATLAELQVTMMGLQPIVRAKVNGADAEFIVDSGAFYSTLAPFSADQKLPLRPAPRGFRIEGIGGYSEVSLTTVKAFGLAGAVVPNIEFIVEESDLGNNVSGLLGQNVLRISDVEFDLANGNVRLLRPDSGCRNASLSYWLKPQQVDSVIELRQTTPAEPQTIGYAFLNGKKLRVQFDSGSPISMLSLHSAAEAGIKPDSPGVTPSFVMHGAGRAPVQTWLAPFAVFKIGDEEIRNTALRMGDMHLPNADMLIGADFFLSHRIYVSNTQRKLYFTYNGGSVFNLSGVSRDSSAPEATAGAADEPVDAAGYARRGAAFASRRDFERAIIDLNRACELDPANASYFSQRAAVHWQNKQPTLTIADLDQTLKLRPDDVKALLARAEARFQTHAEADADSDLDAASRLIQNGGDLALEIAAVYEHERHYQKAIKQFDLWIALHRLDGRLSSALNLRCWARAQWGQELDLALADCNRAVKLSSSTAAYLDSRGLVRLRLGDFDHSIADYDAALKLNPKSAWSLYGRGIGKLHKGRTAEGDADIAAAKELDSKIPETAAKVGILPP